MNRFEWTFEDSSTNAVSRHWDFGVNDERGTSTKPKATYTYSTSGTFTVTLVVKNASGVEKTITKQIVIAEAKAPSLWIDGVYSSNIENPSKPMSFAVAFSAASGHAHIVEYTINYADGSGPITQSVPINSSEIGAKSFFATEYTYLKPGKYMITVSVKDSDGKIATATATAHARIITAIAFKTVTLFHTPKDSYGPVDGYPDPFFMFVTDDGLVFRPRYVSPVLNDRNCNGANGMEPRWAIWDVVGKVPNLDDNNHKLFRIDFYEDSSIPLSSTTEQMGLTPEVTFDELKQSYPDKLIILKDDPMDKGIGVQVDYDYIISP